MLYISDNNKEPMESPLVPSPGFVVIEPVEKDQKTASGLTLPEESKDDTLMGKVISVGKQVVETYKMSGSKKGEELVTPEGENVYFEAKAKAPCKEGDTIIHKKYKDQTISLKGKEYKVVPFQDILATLR